jgi:hypothetical protein
MISFSLFIVAAFSSSSTYQLNNYSIGPGATNNATSTTYSAQANLGETAGTANSTTYTAHNGGVPPETLNTPLAPTLSNGGGTYYNELQFILSNSNEPANATYDIAVSPNAFTTTYYVQASGTLGGTPVFQTYTAWGGASGQFMIGLSNNTTYEAKVSAAYGKFTNSEWSPIATSSTTAPSITFSISPTSINLGNLTAGSVITGGTDITASLTTNAESGANVFVNGEYGGLHSTSKSYTIAAVTGNLAALSEGFGLQGVSTTESSGGPLTLQSPYNGSANNVGIESSAFRQIYTTADAVTGGSGTIAIQAKSASTDPAGTDYSELLTFSASNEY